MTAPGKLKQLWTETGNLAREITAVRVTILATAGIALGQLVSAGVIPDGVSGQITHVLTLGLTVVGIASGVLWARTKTTPADPDLSPTATTGQPLIEANVAAGLLADHAAAAVAQPTLTAAELDQLDQLAAATLAGAASTDPPAPIGAHAADAPPLVGQNPDTQTGP